MSWLNSRSNLLAVVLATSAFLAAFGVALAATVQVSRDISSTLNVVGVDVLADENLVVSHDPEGNDLVDSIEFTVVKVQPPLRNEGFDVRVVYIRNESPADLRLIDPCYNEPSWEVRADYHDMITDEFVGETCDRTVVLSPGETIRSRVRVAGVDPELAAGEYPFTVVFGAIGDSEPVEAPDGIVSWWPGDGNANDIVDDNDGTLLNGATFTQGKVGQGFSFDGDDDLVEVADDDNLNISGDATVELWVQGTGDSTFLVKGNNVGGDGPRVFQK